MDRKEENNTFTSGDKVLWLGKEAEVLDQVAPAKYLILTQNELVHEIWESELVRV